MTRLITIFIAISSVIHLNAQTQAFLRTGNTNTCDFPIITIKSTTGYYQSQVKTIDGINYAIVSFIIKPDVLQEGVTNVTSTIVVGDGGACLDVLIVGGGGSGGTATLTKGSSNNNYRHGGGGGGGEVVELKNVYLPKGTYTMAVGGGGVPSGNNGFRSYIGSSSTAIYNNYAANGGGGGKGINQSGTVSQPKDTTGSGGGGSSGSNVAGMPAKAYSSQARAYSGGSGYWSTATNNAAGGGGGATEVGSDASVPSGTAYVPGAGGKGYESFITGESRYYGGGGMGAGRVTNTNHDTLTRGGIAGVSGTSSAAGSRGTPARGDGGGGATSNATSTKAENGAGGAGTAGIIIIRYKYNSTTPPVRPPLPEGTPDPYDWGMTDGNAINFVNEVGRGMTQEEGLALDTLVTDLKANQIWDSLYAIYPFVGSSVDIYPSTHRANLKSPYQNATTDYYATLIGSFAHDGNGAYGNGEAIFETNMNPSFLKKDSMIVGIYSALHPIDSSESSKILSSKDSFSVTSINLMYKDTLRVQLNSHPDSIFKASNTAAGGLVMAYRNSSDTLKVVNKGVRYVKRDVSPGIPNKTVWLSAEQSLSFTADSYSQYGNSFAFIGGYLTDAHVDSLHDIIERFQTRLGRKVPEYMYDNAELNTLLYNAAINGDTLPTHAVLTEYDTLITKLKTHGSWSKMDALYSFLHDGGESFSFYNLKDYRLNKLSENGNVRFTKKSGADPNTAGNHYFTNYAPGTNNITVGAVVDDTTRSLSATSVLVRYVLNEIPNRTLIKADTAYITSRTGVSPFTYPSAYGRIRAFSLSRNTTSNFITSIYGVGETTSGTDSVSLTDIDTTFKIFDNTTWVHPLKFLYMGITDTSLYADNIGTYFLSFEESLYSLSDTVEYLVVAGGGGGGRAGAGGAGGFRTGNLVLQKSISYDVKVGLGGAGSSFNGNNGNNSVFSTITSIGGGYGARVNINELGGSGGSGGGSMSNTGGGAGTAGQGNNGGIGNYSSTNVFSGGGGGGAGSVGANAISTAAGNGGSGLSSSITGTSVIYAAGGGGGVQSRSRGIGGSSSIGGNGGGYDGSNDVNATNGTANTGSGGGGGGQTSTGTGKNGGNGASGVVIIALPRISKYLNYTVTGFVLNTSYFVDTTTRPGFIVLKFINTTGANQQTGTITFNN